MSTSAPTASTTVHLVATYTSPRVPGPQTLSSTPLSLPLQRDPSTTPLSVSDRTAFLSSLRSATIALQDRINTDLTARMEEDAAITTQDSGSAAKTAAAQRGGAESDEIAEEENYGEEQPPEDDE
ncbi:hypothetical protein RRF57_011601 [Xylaria bambusicola]|uniref:EKC/KEOPS complex subunit GON7 n=1 Tax=Xylaria bambusicola TaxID=326684 RepID=A0AAN7UWZ6_9PEZI